MQNSQARHKEAQTKEKFNQIQDFVHCTTVQ